MEIVRHFLPNFVLMSSMLIIWYKLLNKKMDFKNPKLYITLIGVMAVSITNYILVNNFVRLVVLILFFILFFRFLFKEKLQICIVTPVFYQVIALIAEFIYAIFITILKIDINLTLTSVIFSTISNILIAVISIILSRIKIVNIIYKKVINFTDRIKSSQLLFFCLLAILVENILIMSTYYEVEFRYLLIFNVIFITVCFIIIIYSLMTKNSYNKVYDKYNVAIKSLNDYENMMSKYRIANHENKNLLLTIRAMILNKEKDIPKFIDTMIEDKYEDDEKLLFKMAVIPSGGLRGTIYSEIMKIKDNKINYSLDIDKNLRTIDLIELDTNTIIDICKIIGVFIDNAIDEVKRLRKKNIVISIYLQDSKLNVKVSNNYKDKINIDKISNEGYTTKGYGHGYGLSLVKNIVRKNNLFQNKIEINGNLFSQILTIQYKKSH